MDIQFLAKIYKTYFLKKSKFFKVLFESSPCKNCIFLENSKTDGKILKNNLVLSCVVLSLVFEFENPKIYIAMRAIHVMQLPYFSNFAACNRLH